MNSCKITHQIKENQKWFESFNTLAEETFEISFSKWRELGYWNDRYIPYAFINNNEVIANASVTTSELVIGENHYKGIQIGTVMTKQTHQNQGLSRKLIEKIIADYKDTVDFIYLFANDQVLDFYPKFGFKRRDETLIEINPNQIKTKKDGMVSVTFTEEKRAIESKARQRNNEHLATYLTNIDQLTLFYYSTAFEESIFYIKELDVYVCYEIEGNKLYLLDILSAKKIDIKEVLSFLPLNKIDNIYCHFDLKEQEDLDMVTKIVPMDDDALFMIENKGQLTDNFKLPLISHA